MRQFSKILKFEFKNYFTNKAFVGITLFLVVVMGIVMFFPRFVDIDDESSPMPQDVADEVADLFEGDILLLADAEGNAEFYLPLFRSAFPEYRVKTVEADADAIQNLISSGEATCAFLLDSGVNYTYYVDNLSMFDENEMIADEALRSAYRLRMLTENGVDPAEAEKILSVEITHEAVSVGKDQTKNYFYTYVMIIALYTVILVYGQMVASNVASEKSSRAMELLITSARPVSMMFGKVIASCLAGFVQIAAVFGSAMLFFNLNRDYWANTPWLAAFFDIPPQLLLYMLLFFVLGFLIYAFLYGAMGSTVSKLEDVGTAVMPITFLFLFGYIITVVAMSSSSIDSTLMKVCSYLPFTSPMVMFTRIAMSDVSASEIVISVAILALSVIGTGVIAAKIYRIGVLLYGTKPSLKTVLSALKKS